MWSKSISLISLAATIAWGCSHEFNNPLEKCGDGVVDTQAGETCDGDCPAECDDHNACTTDTLTGSAANCNAACSFELLSQCMNDDGCCPAKCDSTSDNDCSDECGDGNIDDGETCDPPASCPTSCDDENTCTTDTMTGSAQNCNVDCINALTTQCIGEDDCCPADCNPDNDSDCSAECGNGEVEQGETCDPPDTCPTDCDDQDPCTSDSLTGSAQDCDAACSNLEVTECLSGDGCCPVGCSMTDDDDCPCDPGFHPCDTTCCPWHIEVVDSDGPTAVHTALALDIDDRPHIAYTKIDPDGEYRHAVWNGSAWEFTVIYSGMGVNQNNPLSLAIDSDNVPRAALIYQIDGGSDFLYYCTKENGSWHYYPISSIQLMEYASMDLDGNGDAHFCYHDADSDKDLVYEYEHMFPEPPHVVDSLGVVGRYCKIAVDGEDHPHISYLDASNHILKYAYYDGSNWELRDVDSDGRVGQYNSLKLDQANNPNISYYDDSNQNLKFARWVSDDWEIHTVDSNPGVGQHTWLALDAQGNPHISYLDSTNRHLRYARLVGPYWEIMIVDPDQTCGGYTSIALDQDGNPHISYHDEIYGTLKYARW